MVTLKAFCSRQRCIRGQVITSITYTSNDLNKKRQSLFHILNHQRDRSIPGVHVEMDFVQAGLR